MNTVADLPSLTGIEQLSDSEWRWTVVSVEFPQEFRATGIAHSSEEAERRQGLVINACKDLWK